MSRAKSFQLVISPNFSAAGILRPVKYRSSILRENLLFTNIRVSAYSIQLQKYSDGYLTTTLKFAHETTRVHLFGERNSSERKRRSPGYGGKDRSIVVEIRCGGKSQRRE